jgi:hypothetical protein
MVVGEPALAASVGLITNSSVLPPRTRVKAIRLPSGDHAGPDSEAGPWVKLIRRLPSAFMTKMSALPPRTRVNAILLTNAIGL